MDWAGLHAAPGGDDLNSGCTATPDVVYSGASCTVYSGVSVELTGASLATLEALEATLAVGGVVTVCIQGATTGYGGTLFRVVGAYPSFGIVQLHTTPDHAAYSEPGAWRIGGAFATPARAIATAWANTDVYLCWAGSTYALTAAMAPTSLLGNDELIRVFGADSNGNLSDNLAHFTADGLTAAIDIPVGARGYVFEGLHLEGGSTATVNYVGTSTIIGMQRCRIEPDVTARGITTSTASSQLFLADVDVLGGDIGVYVGRVTMSNARVIGAATVGVAVITGYGEALSRCLIVTPGIPLSCAGTIVGPLLVDQCTLIGGASSPAVELMKSSRSFSFTFSRSVFVAGYAFSCTDSGRGAPLLHDNHYDAAITEGLNVIGLDNGEITTDRNASRGPALLDADYRPACNSPAIRSGGTYAGACGPHWQLPGPIAPAWN